MLELKDAPMFGRVMRDEELCKGVLEAILGFEIDRITYLNTEQTFDPATDTHGVRLDVYAKGTGKSYDIEMQTISNPSLMRRMRFYQASIDNALLDKGQFYEDLDESYIIFICAFDNFKKQLPVYTIEHTCKEDLSIGVDDGVHWLVLNTSAWDKDANNSRAELLQYIHSGKVNGRLSTKLDEAVCKVNSDAEWRRQAMGFMTLEMSHEASLRSARKEGIQEGIELGKEQGLEQGEAIQAARDNEFVKQMLDAGRIDDLHRSTEDPQFREQLFEELGL